jgi:hypothetical protein
MRTQESRITLQKWRAENVYAVITWRHHFRCELDIYSYEETYLKLCQVFRNASLAENATALNVRRGLLC